MDYRDKCLHIYNEKWRIKTPRSRRTLLFQSNHLTFDDKLQLAQSQLIEVMGSSEFTAIKQEEPRKRQSFFMSVIRAKIENKMKQAAMKSGMNQKAQHAKMMQSVLKPSLQNVLIVDLVN